MVCIEGAEVRDSADTILRELQQKDRYHSDDRRVDDHECNGEPDARCCKRWTCKKHCRAMGVSVYYGFLGLTGASPKHEAHEAAGMLVIFGFGIFVLLFVSSYTGATAAILISESGRSATINSMKDLQASGGKICIMAAQKTPFELRYPEFGGKLIPQRLADGVLSKTLTMEGVRQRCCSVMGGTMPLLEGFRRCRMMAHRWTATTAIRLWGVRCSLFQMHCR